LPPDGTDGILEALKRVRIRDSPGNRRALSQFARIARSAFDEIEELRYERFSLVTICKALETEGYLPEGSDPGSLSKALRRERKRRGSRSRASGVRRPAKDVHTGESPQGGTGMETADGADNAQQSVSESNVPGMRLKPGNKFVIRQLDLEGLPEL
jgi:hypothetical protein